MAFPSLENSFVYKNLNQNNIVSNNVVKLLTEGTMLTKQNLEEAFLIISKNFKYPLKYKIMEEIDNGDIVLMYAQPNIKIPTCMPFFLTQNKQNKVVAVVAVDIYGQMSKDNKFVTIDAKKLYTIMEAAYLAKLFYHYSKQISTRNIIITNGSSVYSNMFTRVLNKKYALNVDKSKMHKVLFLSSKFYMINILGLHDSETVTNYALKNCTNGNPFILKEINDMLEIEDYADLSTFIQALTRPELGLGLTDLTVRGYLEGFIHMYDGSALLALENFAYFIYNVLAVTNGAYINNQYILEDIVDKNGPKIYADLLSVDR